MSTDPDSTPQGKQKTHEELAELIGRYARALCEPTRNEMISAARGKEHKPGSVIPPTKYAVVVGVDRVAPDPHRKDGEKFKATVEMKRSGEEDLCFADSCEGTSFLDALQSLANKLGERLQDIIKVCLNAWAPSVMGAHE